MESAFGETVMGSLLPSMMLPGARPVSINVTNATSIDGLELHWVDSAFVTHNPRPLGRGGSHIEDSYEGHSFAVANSGRILGCYRITRPLPNESMPRVLTLTDGGDDSVLLRCLHHCSSEEEILVALADMEEDGSGDPRLLRRYLAAIIDKPDEGRFRTLKISNVNFHRACWVSAGARHLFHVLGFRIVDGVNSLGDSAQAEEEASVASPPILIMDDAPSSQQMALIRAAFTHLGDLEALRQHQALATSSDHTIHALQPIPAVAWSRLRRAPAGGSGGGSGGGGSGGGGGTASGLSNEWPSGHWVTHEEQFSRAQQNRSRPPPPPPGRRNGPWGR